MEGEEEGDRDEETVRRGQGEGRGMEVKCTPQGRRGETLINAGAPSPQH